MFPDDGEQDPPCVPPPLWPLPNVAATTRIEFGLCPASHVGCCRGRTVGYAASRSVWGNHRTVITVVSTAGHARPGALVEIDAVAIIPE